VTAPEILAAAAERMNRLDEVGVTWDRCVLHDASGIAYGWISRDDGRSDFVTLEFQWGDTTGLDGKTVQWFSTGNTTSSAKHSARISELLVGAGSKHKDCERVRDVFGALVNRSIEAK
jgi:hypothetical protein